MFSSFGSPLYENFQDKPPVPTLNCNMLKKRRETINKNLQTVQENLKKHNCGINNKTTPSTIEPFYSKKDGEDEDDNDDEDTGDDDEDNGNDGDNGDNENDGDNGDNGNNGDNGDNGDNGNGGNGNSGNGIGGKGNNGKGNNGKGNNGKGNGDEDNGGEDNDEDTDGDDECHSKCEEELTNCDNSTIECAEKYGKCKKNCEKFVGNQDNIVEGFVGHSEKINLHFVLKCILFACLFFILAHDDTRNYLVSMVKIKKGQYIYLGSVLFFVIYLILNMIL